MIRAIVQPAPQSVRAPPIDELTAVDPSVVVGVDFAKAYLHLLDGHCCVQPIEQQFELFEIDATVIVAIGNGEFLYQFAMCCGMTCMGLGHKTVLFDMTQIL